MNDLKKLQRKKHLAGVLKKIPNFQLKQKNTELFGYLETEKQLKTQLDTLSKDIDTHEQQPLNSFDGAFALVQKQNVFNYIEKIKLTSKDLTNDLTQTQQLISETQEQTLQLFKEKQHRDQSYQRVAQSYVAELDKLSDDALTALVTTRYARQKGHL